MYTQLEWATKDRYKYNAFKVINVSPTHLPVYDYMNTSRLTTLKNQINSNIANLINQLGSQFTTRQKNALTEVGTIITTQFDWLEFYGVHEFRFEGAGCYQNGNGVDDSYSPDEVSAVSVDFRNLGGNHNEAGFPSNFNDGFGLYGAMSVVYRDGDIMAVFTRASTLPDQMEQDDTVAEGTYFFKVDFHYPPGGTSYKALRLHVDEACTNDQLPTAIDHVSPSGVADSINSHKGYINMRGSTGCQTLQNDQFNESIYTKSDYTNYIDLFTKGEIGKFVIRRYVTLPNA